VSIQAVQQSNVIFRMFTLLFQMCK